MLKPSEENYEEFSKYYGFYSTYSKEDLVEELGNIYNGDYGGDGELYFDDCSPQEMALLFATVENFLPEVN